MITSLKRALKESTSERNIALSAAARLTNDARRELAELNARPKSISELNAESFEQLKSSGLVIKIGDSLEGVALSGKGILTLGVNSSCEKYPEVDEDKLKDYLLNDVLEKHSAGTKEESIELISEYKEKGQLKYLSDYLMGENNAIFGDPEWIEEEVVAREIYEKLSGEALEVLCQCVDSPKFDGDVVSKSGKGELYENDLLVKIANNNDHGDNAANTLGWLVYKQWKRFNSKD